MIKIFIRTIFRNLIKDKFHLSLNIAGLAIGLAAFIYLTSFIFYELSYDKFHSNSDRIFRCVAFAKLGNNESTFARSELPLAEAALDDLPEIEDAIRLFPIKNLVVIRNETKFTEDEIWYAEKHLFTFFDFNLSEGDNESALSLPHSIVLTKKAAEKYFGDENPIGKSLVIGDKNESYRVTGILNKVPSNSHLQFEMLASFSSLPDSRWGDRWGDFTATYTYVLVKKGTNISAFNEKFKHFADIYWGPMMKNAFGKSMAELRSAGNYLRYELQPITDIHLSSTFTEELQNQGNLGMLVILGITGIFILIIASFNFINLSTAKASLRAKEIGIKKIIGSSRNRIIYQVFFESFFHSLLALIIALGILLLTIPVISSYFEIEINAGNLANRYSLVTVITIPFIITLLAGMYPSFYISRYKPEEILNKKFSMGKSKAIIRNALVSVQFTVFIILIISSIVIGKQIHFLNKQNPGFNKENVLVVKNTSQLKNSSKTFKEKLLNNPNVIDASFASVMPSADEESFKMFCEKGKENQTLMKFLDVDQNFYSTLKIRMKQGRWFYKNELDSEKNNAIVNEEAARLLGWKDYNDKILYSFNMGGNDYNIVGIIENFHTQSLKEKPLPMVIRISDQGDFLALRIRPGESRSVNEFANAEWNNLNSDVPFEYFFLDQNFDAQYRKEDQLIKLIGVFTIIAILIACVGLFGLVSFSSLQRQKEIGIRKVNGAKIIEVMTMLNKDLIRWVIIAFIVASPMAWLAMNKWLENFAYKTSLSWWIFALAGVLALGIALLTVSWQSWKAATQNPLEALRYE